MSRIPPVDSICLTEPDRLIIILAGRPRSRKVERFATFIRSQPDVSAVSVVYGVRHPVLFVNPTQPVKALQLLAYLKTILNPRRPINVHLYQGRVSTPTESAQKQVVCAVEFVLPTDRATVNDLCEQFLDWVEHYKGQATLVRRHERFFVVSFCETRSGRALGVILEKNLGLAVNLHQPMNEQNGLTTVESVVASLLGRHS
ncbi:MAG TPA: hypothetical protein VFO38_00895 [Candidatus Saccharimonadales bacterium]|nr:hypothetical protein [Candidatus Saccharimonadales bacterium]